MDVTAVIIFAKVTKRWSFTVFREMSRTWQPKVEEILSASPLLQGFPSGCESVFLQEEDGPPVLLNVYANMYICKYLKTIWI